MATNDEMLKARDRAVVAWRKIGRTESEQHTAEADLAQASGMSVTSVRGAGPSGFPGPEFEPIVKRWRRALRQADDADDEWHAVNVDLERMIAEGDEVSAIAPSDRSEYEDGLARLRSLMSDARANYYRIAGKVAEKPGWYEHDFGRALASFRTYERQLAAFQGLPNEPEILSPVVAPQPIDEGAGADTKAHGASAASAKARNRFQILNDARVSDSRPSAAASPNGHPYRSDNVADIATVSARSASVDRVPLRESILAIAPGVMLMVAGVSMALNMSVNSEALIVIQVAGLIMAGLLWGGHRLYEHVAKRGDLNFASDVQERVTEILQALSGGQAIILQLARNGLSLYDRRVFNAAVDNLLSRNAVTIDGEGRLRHAPKQLTEGPRPGV